MGSKGRYRRAAGMTLIELIVAISILVILTTMAVPMTRVIVKRRREAQLFAALTEIRAAIDRYKDMADAGSIQIQTDSYGYPPDLETLVKGVEVGPVKLRFLRSIPIDPMTHSTTWGLHAVQDDPSATSWGGQDVFDVFTTSQGTALDGTSYSKW